MNYRELMAIAYEEAKRGSLSIFGLIMICPYKQAHERSPDFWALVNKLNLTLLG